MTIPLANDDLESASESKYLVNSLLNGLAVLECFSKEESVLTISQIAEKLEVNRSSAFRLIYTLESAGYIRKLPNKTYTLNSKVMKLGFNVLSNQDIIELSRPILRNLRDQTAAACNLAVLEDTELVYINHIDAIGPFTSTVKIGTRWPAHATVMGQLLLSALPVEEVKRRYKHFKEWKQYSELTPYHLPSLLNRLDYVRTQKIMMSWGHFLKGVAVCTAPIYRQRDGKMVAVISISCPMNTFSKVYFEDFIQNIVMNAAEELSSVVF
ncbi:IclR family transcriptional regulator [Acinetobacter apis]|uniref:Transcriptional regulator, IclR family n=1 Tax=Acinetobacter apis TaxID=1229165 RepID=A0A217EEK6_9GAMM|nr:IclR family transcriptional regulator [Acinetobacter apis]SNQ28747.1 transcriptional regulator, IclR family [Acinetobacter apis]